MVLLPLVAFALVWQATHDRRRRLGLERLSARGTFVVAYAIFNALVLAVTELTSIGQHLTAKAVAAAWLGSVAVLLGLGRVRFGIRRRLAVAAASWRSAGFAERVVAGLVAAYVAILAVVAGLYRPATGDALSYHLPRVEHWIQNATVAPFATHFLPQIDLSPLDEYSITQLHLLAGTDRLDGFVQLLAYIVCAVAVSEVARLLGGSRHAQVLAPALAITIPVAILQATGAQNDLFGAAIGLCLFVVVLSWQTSGPFVVRAALLGLCVGLTVVAKGPVPPTIGLAVLGLGVLAAGRELQADRRAGARRLGVTAAVALIVAAIAAGPFLARNVALFGSPAGGDQDELVVKDITLRSAGANTVRSIAANFRVGNGRSGPEYELSKVALDVGRDAFDLFDIERGDHRYIVGEQADAFAHRDYTVYQRWSEHGANPWHVLLLAASGIALVVSFVHHRTGARLVVMIVGLSAGFVVFASLVRWQVSAVRFQLPGLMAWCPLMAIALERTWRLIAYAVVPLLVVASLPMLLQNGERPLIDPTFDDTTFYMDDYFPPALTATTTAAELDALAEVLAASSCDALGLLNQLRAEYLLWVGLEHHGWNGEIQAIEVDNDSAELLDEGFVPCATVRFVPLDDRAPISGDPQFRFGELVLTFVDG